MEIPLKLLPDTPFHALTPTYQIHLYFVFYVPVYQKILKKAVLWRLFNSNNLEMQLTADCMESLIILLQREVYES